ncbi:MAG: hypothetical protein EOO00_05850 [Chitinophagaceae bacterium]|nr:MAG: hypothetical protein EOO00_05850 [Chitinophagaceae bacterium]
MQQPSTTTWQNRLHSVIYESSTPAGKAFDISLLFLIVTSIIVVMLDSIAPLHSKYGDLFWTLEWIYTIIFSVEFFLRLICPFNPSIIFLLRVNMYPIPLATTITSRNSRIAFPTGIRPSSWLTFHKHTYCK